MGTKEIIFLNNRNKKIANFNHTTEIKYKVKKSNIAHNKKKKI